MKIGQLVKMTSLDTGEVRHTVFLGGIRWILPDGRIVRNSEFTRAAELRFTPRNWPDFRIEFIE